MSLSLPVSSWDIQLNSIHCFLENLSIFLRGWQFKPSLRKKKKKKVDKRKLALLYWVWFHGIFIIKWLIFSQAGKFKWGEDWNSHPLSAMNIEVNFNDWGELYYYQMSEACESWIYHETLSGSSKPVSRVIDQKYDSSTWNANDLWILE